ncbi:MAG: SRPBCC family protein [Bacteroidota bacterium]
MKFLKKLVIALLIIVAFVLIAALFLPSTKHVEDSLTINAPSKDIYEQVVNMRNWQKWSPFGKDDTAMKTTYEGPMKGVGAVMRWKSKKQGNGVMTVLEVEKNKSIKTQIEFEGQGISHSNWTFAEGEKSTIATWAIDVEHLSYPIGRLMGIVMQNMLHKSFQQGLASLKKVSEDYSKMLGIFKTSDVKVKQMEKQYALIIKDSSKCDDVDVLLAKLYGELGKFVGENKIQIVNAPFARYLVWDNKTNKNVMEAGFFIRNKVQGKGNIKCIEMPAGKVAIAKHFGAYETTYKSHEVIENYIKQNKLLPTSASWEIYITDPEKEPDMTKWETEIVYPIK